MRFWSRLARRVPTKPQPQQPAYHPPDLDALALASGRHDRCRPEQLKYHLDAEGGMDEQWERMIWPWLQELDLRVVVDLAAGFGRNSAKLLPYVERMYVVDINQECVDRCKQRFQGHKNVSCFKNDGVSLKEIDAGTVTLVYCFDAMVHFDSDIVRSYLQEFHRLLVRGGTCFCHHSNYTEHPGGGLTPPHSRNFMSKELFAHYAIKTGLAIVRQEVIDWGGYDRLDCLSLIQKP